MTALFQDTIIESRLSSIKKFYFLEYFLIFLKSVSKSAEETEIFNLFKIEKDEYKLGESRYKKLGISLEEKKLNRYKYTFTEVLEELEIYKLVKRGDNKIYLTEKGKELLSKYNNSYPETFYLAIFQLMEEELHGFYQMINNCYKVNKNGLLIFPIYSPLKLGLAKAKILNSKDIITYLNVHTHKLENDVLKYLNQTRNLSEPQSIITNKLIEADLISANEKNLINPDFYYIILKRIRDFWLNYFLKEIYGISLSLSYFDIWCYRGKQIGIINITEFYPNFDGRIVYPISIISENINNSDFKKIFTYKTNESLYIHEPSKDKFQHTFTKVLYETYIDLKHSSNSYFINIADLRDVVCFKLKISYRLFQECLELVYYLNLNNKTTIKISLEADRLPDETKLAYQKREPVFIEGQLRNIIAIDLKNE